MTLSASAARLRGDDYQHLFAWYHALRALDPSSGVTGVEVEAVDAGNVDDLVVRRSNGADEFYQVKYSVDASSPINHDWFVTPTSKGGTSPLTKFWKSWKTLSNHAHAPHLALFTNRALDLNDPLLKLRDGHLGRLMPRAGEANPGSEAGKRRKAWADHLAVSESDLLEMLSNFDILTDQGAHAMLVTSTADRMAAMQLRYDDDGVAHGIEIARSWVTSGTRTVVDRTAIAAEIERRKLRGDIRRASLVVEGIDRWPFAEAATASANWVDLFVGDEPRVRRQLRDPTQWNGRIRDDLRRAESRVRGMGYDRVLVRGYMRLPSWFAVGAHFADSRGYRVATEQRGQLWSSDAESAECDVVTEHRNLDGGDDLALALSVTNDLSVDVENHVRSAALPIGRFVHIAVSPRLGHEAITSAGHARAWALKVRELVREEVRKAPIPRLHLFMSGPAGAALLLGHIWNRVPSTQLYEDLNPGYAPTILIPA
jgi:SMODS-associated and fused to various effectors sensor domain